MDKSKAYVSEDFTNHVKVGEVYQGSGKELYYRTIKHQSINGRAAIRRVYHPFSSLLYEELQYLLQRKRPRIWVALR